MTFSDFALPPLVAAVAEEPNVKELKPSTLAKVVGTVAVWLTETALGVDPLQLGRFDVEVTQTSVGDVLVMVT
jgi:hypothetical protein